MTFGASHMYQALRVDHWTEDTPTPPQKKNNPCHGKGYVLFGRRQKMNTKNNSYTSEVEAIGKNGIG